MATLFGKIFWVEDDFNFMGNYVPKKDETSHTVALVKNVIIDDNIIKFTTSPVDYRGEFFSYTINLFADTIGLGYTGAFSENTDPDWKGMVKCELFENKKTYFLYGKWAEDNVQYTWWAHINKIAANSTQKLD